LGYGTLDPIILSFLQDIQRDPDSGIANRYKRLQISVRQGQKLKNIMLSEELIQEHNKITRAGRMKVIQMTNKGKALLSQTESE